MTMKKITSLALSGAVALSLSAPALATDTTVDNDTTSEAEITINGTTKIPTIKVTVPDSGAVVVNPYQLEHVVKAETSQGAGDAVTSNKQIVNATQWLASESDTTLDVNVTAVGELGADSAASFATTSTQGKNATKDKAVYMWFEIVNADDNTTEPTTWSTAYNAKNANQILIAKDEDGNTGKSKSKMVTLAPKSTEVPKTYAAFHLAGDACAAPDDAWTTDDTIDVKLTFTFTPVMNDESAGA